MFKIRLVLALYGLSIGLATGQNLTGELVLNPNKWADEQSAATISNRTVFAPSNIFPLSTDQYISPLYLLKNDTLRIESTLILEQELNYDHPYVTDIISVGDSMFAVAVADFAPSGSLISRNAVLFLDTTLNVINRYDINDSIEKFTVYTLNIKGDKLLVYFNNKPNGAPWPRIHFYDLNLKSEINQKTYIDSSMFFDYFELLYRVDTGYMAFGTFFTFDRVGYLLDSSFNYVKTFTIKDPKFSKGFIGLTPRFSFDVDQVLFSNKDYIYATGYSFNSLMTLAKFDQNLKLLRLDTFGVPSQEIADGMGFWASLDEFVHGATSYQTLDSIFITGSQNAVNIFSIPIWQNEIVKPEQNAYVYNIDTAGNINWRKEIHQDSTIFITTAIEATPDGGALVFSSKFDLKYKLSPHLRISVIKLDRFGNVVSEREFTPPQPRWSVYPNPMRSRFTLTGLEENETVQMQLLNLNGQVMWEQTGRAGAYTLPPQLEKGFYLLQLSNEQGQNLGVRRVMVEGR